MKEFFFRIWKSVKCHKHLVAPHLSRTQQHLLHNLQHNHDIIITNSDKNLGPCIQRLTTKIATQYRQQLLQKIQQFIKSLQKNKQHQGEVKFLQRRLLQDNNTPKIYGLPKVHKNPMKLCPIVQICGTPLSGLAAWVDSKLQSAARSCPTALRDSKHLLSLLDKAKNLFTPSTFFFTADAISYYSYINIDTGINGVTEYLTRNHPEMKIDKIIEGLRIVMTNNVFDFGDTHWKQIRGTAMGVPPAPPYATLYYANHEQQTLTKHP